MAKISDVIKQLELLSQYIPIAKSLNVSEAWRIPENYIDNPKCFPNSEFPGVYIFTDKNANILYIGKASSGLGSRIGNGYLGRNRVRKSDKIINAHYLYTVKLNWEEFFLAPAIEEYLISELDPSGNKIGRRRDVFKLKPKSPIVDNLKIDAC